MGFGELNINYSDVSGSLFFKDSTGNVRKVGPAEVGPNPPNLNPEGSEGNSVGELWYDTTSSKLKMWDSSEWVPVMKDPEPRSVGRMYWTNNTEVTIINSSETFYLMNSSEWGLDVHSSGFALSSAYPGLVYTASKPVTVIVTCSGEFDGFNRRDYRFAIAKTSSSPNLPDDITLDSLTDQREDEVGQHFNSESLLSLSPGDTIYPVVKNDNSDENVEISSVTFLIREV